MVIDEPSATLTLVGVAANGRAAVGDRERGFSGNEMVAAAKGVADLVAE